MPNAIENVVADSLCTGCGLCAGHLGQGRVKMHIDREGYLRPQTSGALSEQETRDFKAFCPGIKIKLDNAAPQNHLIWGPVHTCATGWATDPETRHRGSSGGGISAILIALLETRAVDFVAHIAADPAHPYRNALHISRNRADVLTGAGSRYAPSAPLAELETIFAQPGSFAFVGKPCDAAGLRNYLTTRPQLAKRVVAILSFMCAGIPSEKGSEEIVKKMGGDPAQVTRFTYRGNGWPGKATATFPDGKQLEMDYATSWGTILNRHLQFRCKICPDGTGELADIVCADAWYGKDGYPEFEEKAGRSLILTRTANGENILKLAVEAGHLIQEPLPISDISRMQPYQVSRKRLLASRLLAVYMRRRRIPKYHGMRLIRAALGLGPLEHVRNLLGTLKRIPTVKK